MLTPECSICLVLWLRWQEGVPREIYGGIPSMTEPIAFDQPPSVPEVGPSSKTQFGPILKGCLTRQSGAKVSLQAVIKADSSSWKELATASSRHLYLTPLPIVWLVALLPDLDMRKPVFSSHKFLDMPLSKDMLMHIAVFKERYWLDLPKMLKETRAWVLEWLQFHAVHVLYMYTVKYTISL